MIGSKRWFVRTRVAGFTARALLAATLISGAFMLDAQGNPRNIWVLTGSSINALSPDDGRVIMRVPAG
jgi:hypothetical protein